MYGQSVQPELLVTEVIGSSTRDASVILPATVGLVAVPYPGSPPEAFVAGMANFPPENEVMSL